MTDLSQYSDAQLLGMLSQQTPPEDPNDAIKSYGGGLERGAAATAMILPNLLNDAATGPQLLYRGLTGREHDNSPTWKPFYSSEDALQMLPEPLQPHTPTTPGGAIANVAGSMLGAAIAGSSPKQVAINNGLVDPEAMRLGKILSENDVPTYLSDVLPENSATKSALEVTGDLPFAGKGTRAIAQQEGLNQAVAKQMGMDSDVVNPPLMKESADQAGDVFKYVGDNYNIAAPETSKLFNDLADFQKPDSLLDPTAQNKINYQLNYLLSKVDKNGEIPGDAYAAVRSDLGRLARSTSDPDVEMTAYKIQNHLDNAITPSIAPDMQKVFSDNRGYYRNMLATEPAVKAAIKSGDVSPIHLQQGVSKIYPNYIYDDPASLPQLTQGAQLLNKNPTFSSTTPMQRFIRQNGWAGDAAQAAMLGGSPILGPLSRLANPRLNPADFEDIRDQLAKALLAAPASFPNKGKQ